MFVPNASGAHLRLGHEHRTLEWSYVHYDDNVQTSYSGLYSHAWSIETRIIQAS